jgi:Hsp70 protein
MSVPSGTLAVRQPDPVAASGIRLVVDYGTVTSRAMVCWPDGRRLPLVTGWGELHWPSGVLVAADGRLVAGPEALAAAGADPDGPAFLCRDLKSQLTRDQISLGDRTLQPAAGLAALLARLATQARQVTGLPVTELAVTTPAAWGPRHRGVLRAAAERAGLPEPQPIPTPVAAAWLLTVSGRADLPPGATVLICDFGQAAFEASLLIRATAEFAVLATARRPEAGGAAIEALLADHCLAHLSTVDAELADRLRAPQKGTDRQSRMVFDNNIHAVRQSLAAGSTTGIEVPPPHPPVPISLDQYADLVAPIARLCAETTAGVVEAAGVDPANLAGIFSVGGSTTATAAEALAERGLAPEPVPQPDLAVVLGATDTPTPARPAVATGQPAQGWQPIPLVGATVALLASGLLAALAVYSTTVDQLYWPSYALVNWGEYAMAGCCALLAGTALAEALPPPASTPARVPGTVRVPRLAYGVAAGLVACLAIAAASIGHLIATFRLDWGTNSYLRWALLPAIPIAACAGLAGLLQQRYPRETGQAGPAGRRRWFPPEATAAAAIGMTMIQMTNWGNDWFWDDLLYLGSSTANTIEDLLYRIGGILIGVGIALAATTSARLRILTVPVAAAIAGIIYAPTLTTQLGIAFVAAASYWWALRAGRLLVATAPRWRPQPRRAWPPTPVPPSAPPPSAPALPPAPDSRRYANSTAYPLDQNIGPHAR